MEAMKIAEAEHLFDKVLFVPVSSTVEVLRIQEKIASSMQYTFPENEERERAQRLCMRLTQENKILMILDDVWEKLDFAAIGIPSSEHHKGCKVLITTRSEAVCTLMDCQRKIHLPILTDEEAWTLFQKKALISEGTPQSDTLKHLARLISNECKGLPVAIAAVASSLKDKAEVIWSVALNKLRSSKPINIEKGLTDPYKCLQLSYDNLDTDEAKSLFLLCSVFPEDFDILTEFLIRFAIGMGIVEEVHTYEEARSEVIAAKIKLISSCLLLDTDDEFVKMHDLVRDVAHLIAKNENKLIKCELGKDATLEKNSIRYLWCEKIPNNLDCSNLEFLYIATELEELDGIFRRMGKLRVLFLVNNGKEIELPLSSFKTLTDLRCLILCGWELSGLSFVSDMKKLQSLSLYNCSLPSFLELQTNVEVTQLTNLKSLVLHECEMERNIFEVIQKIPQLEELCIIDNSEKWDDYNENTIEFFKTFSFPQALQWYVIKLGSLYDDDDEFLSPAHQRILLLSHFHISNEAMKDLAKKAKVLLIANIEGGAKNIIPDIFAMEGGGMYELNKLEISDSEEIECLVDTSNHLSEVGTLFSKLLKLRIKKMDHLRALWHGCLPANGPFEKLEKLSLSDCPKLTSLFTYVIAQSLVQLKILKIDRCDGLKHIIAADEDKAEKSLDEFKIGHPVQSIIFRNLQQVKVSECGELKHVFSASAVGDLPQLKVLKINDCNKLDQIIEDIVSSTPVMNYPLVQEDQKQEPDEIIEDEQHRHLLNPHFEANQLEIFPENTSIPSAPLVNRSPGSFTLSSLASLKLKSCPKLGSLFTASLGKTLTSLEELIIQNCNGLKCILTSERVNKNQKENIPEDDHDIQSDISMFLSLKRLHISECDLLQHIFPVSFVGDVRNKETSDLKDLLSQNNFEDNSCHQQQKNTQIELPALEELQLDFIPNVENSSYHVRCPSLGKLSLGTARYVGFFAINCSTKARQRDYITIKISKSDSLHPVESAPYLSKQPQGLHLTIMRNIREIELNGFDKVKYLFNLSIASSLMLEILSIGKCPGLEHIIDTGDEYDGNNWDAIFPNLKRLSVYDCGQLEYMLGQFPLDKQHYKEIHIHFPALEILSLRNLPNFVSICATNSLSMTCPSLKEFECDGCSQLFNDSVSYSAVPVDSREPISTSSKDAKGIQNDFLTLQTLRIKNAEVAQVIFLLNGHQMIGQQVSLRLEDLELRDLPQMTYIWVASKNLFTLQYLKTLIIEGCAKLEVIFPPSVLRCLPKLEYLEIRKCNELKQIIKKDVEDRKLSNPQPCFPKLKALVVQQCHKLKCLISMSASNDLPNLELLIINGAAELEELIECEQGKAKVELPKLKLLVFIQLSTLRQGTELLAVKHRIVSNCPKLDLTSSATLQELRAHFPYSDFESIGPLLWEFPLLLDQTIESDEVSISRGTSFENPTEKVTIDLPIDPKSQRASRSGLPSSQINEESKKEFNGKDPGSEVQPTATPTDTELNERPSPSPMDNSLHKSRSHELEDGQTMSGSYLTDPQKPLGETESTTEIPQLADENIGAGFPDQHALGETMNIEEIGKESIQEGPASKGATVKTLSASVDSISWGSGVATRAESSGGDILAQDSQVVEQDDKLNEGKTGITPCKKIQIQEGSNLMDKKDGTSIFSNNSIEIPPASADTRTRLAAYKHLVDLDDAQIALLEEAIAAYPHLWNACEKFSERFQAWMLKTLADMLLFLRNESANNVTPQRGTEFHRLCDEAVELGFERSWVDEMRQRVVARDPQLKVDRAQPQIDELFKRSSGADVVPDSQVIEQGVRQNEHWRGTSPFQKIQNVDDSIQEGSNMIDKEGEIGVVSNDPIVALRNEEPEKEFVTKVSTSEIPAIATSSTNSELVERSSPSYLDIPLHKTHSNELVDRQSMSEPYLMNQQKPLGEIVSTAEIPQRLDETEDLSIQVGAKSEKTVTATLFSDSETKNSSLEEEPFQKASRLYAFVLVQSIKRVAEEGTTSKNTNMAASSMHSESASSQSGQLVTSQSKSYPHSEIRSSQTETYTAKESEGHPKNIQDFGGNDIMSLFQPVAVEEDGEGQVSDHHSTKYNRVVKALAELEKCLKMPLKDIANSETNSLRLLTALNFLSNLPFKDVTLSDGLKDIIDSMHKEFPSILCSFKQAFAATDKSAVLEAHRNEVAITLVSKITEAGNFMDEAQQKEAILKERVIRLKKEIKDCEAALSSLQEEKKKCIAKTIEYKKELENVRKDKSQMEDQRKIRQELLEVAYTTWSALCSQFEYNRISARNPY